MPHDHEMLAESYASWGADTWVANGWRYYFLAGEVALRFATTDSNTGSASSGFDYDWFDPGDYSDEVEPDEQSGPPDPEARMSVTFASWMWWGPRNRYWDKWRDATGQRPSMLCSIVDPGNSPMFCYDVADSSTEMVLLAGEEP